MIDAEYGSNDRHGLVDLLRQLKDEAVEFLATRIQMFVSEMYENFDASKKALTYGLLALLLLATGYLLITLAVVALIAVAFWNSPYAWFFGCLIVGVCWSIFGGLFGLAARANFRGLAPNRTLRVLKEDRSLFEARARNAA